MLQMIRLFQTYPRLGILGMNTYRICRQKESTNRQGNPGWNPDPRTGITWTYVHFTDFAPMAILASVFWELGGLEEGFSRPGECGITGDWELCARAWVAGWQVGHFSWDGRKGDPVAHGGTHTSVGALACWNRQMDVGGGSFTKRQAVIGNRTSYVSMCQPILTLRLLHTPLLQLDVSADASWHGVIVQLGRS
ncbi:hypothetical protein Vretifemale_361 [Volvox reticuliferus]|uniref:Uncharacterized protein n=1 Tax=Volvox reticuliferus TaxID=1737510 RepID=A0A8J4BVR5_9CHLO|nr:hypothetical protein Vretifemale_361 [Volvox reticuliferus]